MTWTDIIEWPCEAPRDKPRRSCRGSKREVRVVLDYRDGTALVADPARTDVLPQWVPAALHSDVERACRPGVLSTTERARTATGIRLVARWDGSRAQTIALQADGAAITRDLEQRGLCAAEPTLLQVCAVASTGVLRCACPPETRPASAAHVLPCARLLSGVRLLPHQREGAAWMLQCESEHVNVPAAGVLPINTALHVHGDEGLRHGPAPTVRLRGGVLADPTGSGKTAVALHVAAQAAQAPSAEAAPGRWCTPATLVLAPHDLADQWCDEARRFYGSSLRVLYAGTAAALRRLPCADVLQAHVVVTAPAVLLHAAYRDMVAELCAECCPGAERLARGQGLRLARRALAASPELRRTRLDKRGPVLEMYAFARVILDEAHEWAAPSRARLLDVLSDIWGASWWGLTGASRDAGTFLPWLAPGGAPCAAVHCAIRAHAPPALPAPVHRRHDVTLSPLERVLLLSKQREGCGEIALRQCCAMAALPERESVRDAVDAARLPDEPVPVCTMTAAARHVVSRAQQHCDDARAHATWQAARGAATRARAQCAADADAALHRSESRLRFVQRACSALSTTTCPVCLDDHQPVSALASCGHAACATCLRAHLRTTAACPMCREPLDPARDVYEVLPAAHDEADAARHGSKAAAGAALIATLPASHQILVLAQWPALLRAVAKCAQAQGVSMSVLQGNAAQRRTTLRRFRDRSLRVLGLELGAPCSGLSLTGATHVLLAHVPCGTPTAAAACVLDAVARARRVGNAEPVHVHHLVARQTPEADAYDAIMCALQKTTLARDERRHTAL